MKHLVLILLTYSALTAQASLRTELAIGSVAPDFLLLVFAAALMVLQASALFVWAAVIGLLSDCMLPDRLGIEMLSVVLAAVLIERMRDVRAVRSPISVMLLIFLMVLAVRSLSHLIKGLALGQRIEWELLVVTTAGPAVYTALIALAVASVWHVAWQREFVTSNRVYPAHNRDSIV